MHKQGIAHRDLKLENILFTSKDKNNLDVRVADFGFSSFFDPKEGFTDMMGTPMFMAPEMFKREKYNEKVDIWSIGILTYEFLVGKPPFESRN